MNTIAMKVFPETEALWKKLKEETDDIKTADQFLSLLLENLQNPRKVTVPDPEDKAKIKELEHKVFSAESELAILREKPDGIKLEKTEIVFKVTEAELTALESLQRSLKARGIEVSISDVLYIFIRDKKLSR